MTQIPKDGFKDFKHLEGWLSSLPEEQTVVFARLIASRAALRALPNIGTVFPNRNAKAQWRFDLTVASFRANAIARVASTYPTRAIDDNLVSAARSADSPGSAFSAARSAFSAADSASSAALSAANSASSAASSSAFSAAFSAASSSAFSAASSAASSSAFSAASSAGSAASSAGSAVWQAVTSDARALENGEHLSVVSARLWPDDSPHRPQFNRKTLLAAAPSFEIWLDWVEPLADGKAPWGLPRAIADKIEKRIALGDDRGDAFWNRRHDEINAEITGWVEEARAELARGDEQALAQRPAPFQFKIVNGRTSAVAMTSKREADAFVDDLWEELREKAVSAHERLGRTQTPKHVLDTLSRLLGVLGDSAADVRPGKLLMVANSIEAIGATYAQAALHEELAGDSLALITDLAESVSDFKGLYPEILQITANRLSQEIAGDATNEVIELSRTIAAEAAQSDAVDETVVAAFQAAFDEIDEQQRLFSEAVDDLSKAVAREKLAETGALQVMTMRNYVALVIKVVKPSFQRYVKDAGKRLRKGTLDGLEDGAKTATKIAFAGLIAKIAGPIAGLAALVGSFVSLSKKAEEITNSDDIEADDDDENQGAS